MATITQDLPPKGGYRPFQIDRIPLRTVIGGRKAIALAFITTAIGHYVYYLEWKQDMRNKIEVRGSYFALKALLIAERDRLFLKQLKRNIAEEKELMRYIPSWKVGTFYGEPIYKTVPEDKFIEPDSLEFYVHTDPEHYYKKFAFSQMI